LGLDEGAILHALGLDRKLLANPVLRLKSEMFDHMLLHMEKQYGDPTFSMRLGNQSGPRNFSDPGYAVRYGPDLAAMFKAMIQMQDIRQNFVDISLSEKGNAAVLNWDAVYGPTASHAAFVECSMAAFCRMSYDMFRQQMELLKVSFTHEARFSSEKYESFFDCPVEFGAAKSSLHISPARFYRRSPKYNPALQSASSALYEKAAAYLRDDKPVAAFCRTYSLIEMDKTPVTIELLAYSSQSSERTLRRKLADEGFTFRQLLEETRRDLCYVYQMEGQRSLGQIAELLGYSELSAFSRSYKNWFGAAPSKYLPQVDFQI
jgi:AraC-like DNA-binding protein